MKWFAKLNRTTLAIGSLVMAGIILLSVNVISGSLLRHMKADLTEGGLFTISEGTREIITSLDEPLDLRLYFSKHLGELAPAYAKYFDRIHGLLEQYRDISGAKLRVKYLDPEPFSDAEDRAVAAGLKGIALNQEGDMGYFGLVGSNSTDNQATIAFFSPDRERFLEYDLTKLVYTLANPKKPRIGLISGLDLNGQLTPQGQQQPPWLVMDQIREFFDVYPLDQNLKEIPDDVVDTLMVVSPDKLTRQAAYAIDQFALRGGRVLAFVDPLAETAGRSSMMAGNNPSPEFGKLLKAWGVAFDRSKVAADITHARRVQFGRGARPVITEHVAWLGLDRRNVDESDVLSAGIEKLNLASPGFLAKREGATTEILPILQTSDQSMAIDATRLTFAPDPVRLLREFKPRGEPLTLAARVTGAVSTAFPDGPPKQEPKEGDEEKAKENAASRKPQVKEGTINAIVVADADMLHDQFWVEANNFLGQTIMVPLAHNATFVLNALDNLSGNSALLSLRGRGVDDRPFRMVEQIRRDAERRYREKEEALVARLQKVKGQLASVEKKGGGGGAILTEDDKAAIENFRRDIVTIRRELRDVKHALRKDIDRLDATLKFINIAGVPFLIGIGGLAVAFARRRRLRH